MHGYSLIYGPQLANFQSRRLGHITAELRIELSDVISKKGGFAARAGDGYVAEAGVEQVRVNASVGIDQDSLSGGSLGTVARDCIPLRL